MKTPLQWIEHSDPNREMQLDDYMLGYAVYFYHTFNKDRDKAKQAFNKHALIEDLKTEEILSQGCTKEEFDEWVKFNDSEVDINSVEFVAYTGNHRINVFKCDNSNFDKE